MNRDAVFTGTGVGTRNITTKVLVDSGSTLVIGGIYTDTDTQLEGGIPYLRQIPIIGWLFGNKSDSNERDELFFFITPRVINPKEAGLS
jgi:type IV pilus assembly protein PilQ